MVQDTEETEVSESKSIKNDLETAAEEIAENADMSELIMLENTCKRYDIRWY